MFLVTVGVLAGIAGKDAITKPSGATHFTHLAQGWLDGRLSLEGKPPGYRKRAHDDWAQVFTLDLKDGSEVRGYPCKTEICDEEKKRTRMETWWLLDQHEWVDIHRLDIKNRRDTWYVSFPPGPAVIMLPFVTIWGMSFWDVLFTMLVAGLIPVVLVRLLDHARGTDEGRGAQHLWAAAAWAIGSPACFVGAFGRVWFTAQIVACLFTMLYLSASWKARRPAQAGIWLGMAMACRLPVAFAIVFFGLEWWRNGRRLADLAKFLVPFGLIGLALGLHNYARFEDFFEFGHKFLDIRWQARMQEYGMFHPMYLSRNLQCLFSVLPQFQGSFPFIKVSMHGMALPLTSPWLALVVLAREKFPQRAGLWLATLAVALPTVLYHNSGQVQFTYRFSLDWLPMVLIALVMGAPNKRWFKWLFPALVVLAMAIHVYGAWMYGHRLGQLLVLEPLGWPFESEFL